jgi:hypothetical protein
MARFHHHYDHAAGTLTAPLQVCREFLGHTDDDRTIARERGS